jgi:hypothetical protein
MAQILRAGQLSAQGLSDQRWGSPSVSQTVPGAIVRSRTSLLLYSTLNPFGLEIDRLPANAPPTSSALEIRHSPEVPSCV